MTGFTAMLPKRGVQHCSTSGASDVGCFVPRPCPLRQRTQRTWHTTAEKRDQPAQRCAVVAKSELGTSAGSLLLDGALGAVPPTTSNAPPTAQDKRLEELTAQVDVLKELVLEQCELIKMQKGSLELLDQRLRESRTDASPPSASPPPTALGTAKPASPFDAQRVAFGDRRLQGLYDARFHSTYAGATPKDFRVLPDKIILVRHAESEGNVDSIAYSYIPDSQVPLTAKGHIQAREAGRKIKALMEHEEGVYSNYRMFFYISPYKRSLQTFEGISSVFPSHRLMGVQEEVQLREQDFGNWQDPEGKRREKADRVRFGRFFYRFPNGESGADVYDRITIFEDHMIRDINAGRFAANTTLVLVSHGLALRIFLMRWLHWTVDQFLSVYNPANAEPLILERCQGTDQKESWMHTKSLYRLTDESMQQLRGCTTDMCATSHMPRNTPRISTRLL